MRRLRTACWIDEGPRGEHYGLTYFPDLSLYAYHTFQPCPNPKLLNVGWLDPSVPFKKGSVDEKLIDGIFNLCKKPVNLTRGMHRCPYGTLESPSRPCPYPAHAVSGARKLAVGNGEIRVTGNAGIVYASPTLICHYIQAHQYCPPEEFLEALKKL
jgi:hypothetical protein